MEVIEQTGLSAQDVKALRQADSVSFHKRAHGKPTDCIQCSKRVKNPGPYDETEKTYYVAVRGVIAGGGVPYGAEGYNCFEMIHVAQFCEVWRTIAQSLKAGDVLTLRWSADNFRNGYVEGARITEKDEYRGMELHADALYLEVTRGEGRKRRKLVFLLDVSVCVDNTARMVRRA